MSVPTAQPLSDLSMCNQAIGLISGDPIDAIGEESPLGLFCAENYPQKRRFLLSKYRWTFCNEVALLARLEIPAAMAERAPMGFRFARPSDMTGAAHDWRDHPDPTRKTRGYYVMESGGDLWGEADRIFVEYTAQRVEAVWPAWFVELMRYAFAADLAGHAQMRSLQRDYEMKAWGSPGEGGEGGLYAQARNEDARMAPPRQLVAGIDPGPLVGVRGGLGLGHWPGFRLGSEV